MWVYSVYSKGSKFYFTLPIDLTYKLKVKELDIASG